jgi:hypothetical protein
MKMKIFFKIALVASVSLLLFACPKEDPIATFPARPYDEVYAEDIVEIDDFIDTHYVTVDADFNTTFTRIPSGGSQTPIRSMSELDFKIVKRHSLDYKVYYLKLNDGVNDSPTKLDSVYASYKGFVIKNETDDLGVETTTQTVFDNAITPIWFELENVIRGWAQLFPFFKSGNSSVNGTTGQIDYQDFGAGVLFIPSGLAYFNDSRTNIPSYTPLIFSIKLYGVQFKDHDRDKIHSKYEYGPDFDEDAIDTDGDGFTDFGDLDDDADGVLTIEEIKFTYDDGGVMKTGYYPYDGAASDDPLTPYDDRRGIPRKFTGPLQNPLLPESATNRKTPQQSDFTDPARLRRHLDKTSKPPYE